MRGREWVGVVVVVVDFKVDGSGKVVVLRLLRLVLSFRWGVEEE